MVTKLVTLSPPRPPNGILPWDRRRKIHEEKSIGDGRVVNFNYLNDLLYRGREDRLQRYRVYDAMDQDIDVARALDMIAEHCTQADGKTRLPLRIDFDSDSMSAEHVEMVMDALETWGSINDLDNRLWRMVRNAVKYGDHLAIRDPRTFELKTVAAAQCVGIYVDKDTQEIHGYHFVDLGFRIPDVMITEGIPSLPEGNSPYRTYMPYQTGGQAEKRFNCVVLADHVLHLSLTEGRSNGANGQHDRIWPFGESFLEQAFADYKKRDLLEHAMVIHRVQRASSKYIWFVDVGGLRGDMADAVLEKFTAELRQKRVPDSFNGQYGIDSVWNPISQMEDIILPVDGGAGDRGTKVQNMEGQEWTNTNELVYYLTKLLRGLRIPTTFLLGPQNGGREYSDGKVGTAYIEEIQFARFCSRIQDVIDNDLDREFKLYLKFRGIEVGSSELDLKFTPPMGWEEYREGALEDERLARLSTASSFPFISKQYALKRFARWTEDDLKENMRFWRMENPESSGDTAIDPSVPGSAGMLGGLPAGGDMGGLPGGGGGGMPSPGGGPGEPGGGAEPGGLPPPEGGVAAGGGGGIPPPTGGGGPIVASNNGGQGRRGSVLLSEDIFGNPDMGPGGGIDVGGSPPSTARQPEDDDRMPREKPGDDRAVANTVAKRKITLRDIRKLRLAREKARVEAKDVMRLVRRMYGGGGTQI